jgi:gliding motility-associated-like protein
VPSTYDAFIYKTDFNGNGEWVRRIRGQSTENFRTLTTDEYDNVYVLGNYNSSTIYVDSTASLTNTYTGNTGGYDTYIGKYNRTGDLQWFLRKGSSAKDIYNDFVVRNNVIYATGYFANQIIFNNDTLRTSGGANEDAFLAAFNEIGDPIAGVSIVGTGDYNDAGTVVNMDTRSRAYVAGYYKSQQIQIGTQTYTSTNLNKSDLFFAIYEHPFKAVITDQKMVSCFGLSDGMLEVTPYFGRPPYTYAWSHDPELTSTVASGLPAGDYTVTVTDTDLKVASITYTVTQPQPLAITGISTGVTCFNGDNGAIDVTVTGGTSAVDYVYNWTSLDGSGIAPLDEDQAGLTPGTYTLSVTDDNLCARSTDFTVTQPAAFNYAGTLITPITIPPGDNGAVNITVTGGTAPYVYQWLGPGTFSAATEDIAGLGTAGLYNLSLTDDNDCVSNTNYAVNDNFTLVAQIAEKTDVLCYGQDNGSATVTVYNGTLPYSFEWSDGFTSGLATRNGMAPGNYTVLLTDGALNTAEASVEILGPPADLILTLAPQDLVCYNDGSGVVDLTVANGTLPYQFAWSNGYTGEDLVNIASGLYTVVVTDGNECTAQGSVTINQPAPIGLDISTAGEIVCQGGNNVMATANATGGVGSFSYLWDDPGTQSTKTAFDLGAGNYTVRVTDANGCMQEASTLITEPDALAVTAEETSPSCAGDADGSIIPTVSGGTPGYEYQWSNNVFERFNTDIPAGTYTLTVTDDNNCLLTQEFVLEGPDTLAISSVDFTDLTCSGTPDGSITIQATGGTGDYSYSTDGGGTFGADATVTGLNVGSYTLVVRDENNCTSEEALVTLEKSELCGLVIYDAFSPNADSYNDVWHIGNIENFPDCTVKIFNTWGIAVFSSNGYGIPWDGMHNGNDLPSGTYYYVIDPGDGSGTLTGPVSLVK